MTTDDLLDEFVTEINIYNYNNIGNEDGGGEGKCTLVVNLTSQT